MQYTAISPSRQAENRAISPALDTLAQLNRSVEDTRKNLVKRARAKYLSSPISIALANVDSPLRQAYWNTYHCCRTIVQSDGRLTAKYCGNRWCMVCNRIRTARTIKAYTPVLEAWTDAHFVTLTLPTVEETELPGQIQRILKDLRQISVSMRTTHRKPLIALRKLECTARPDGKYHPHLHLVVQDREQATLLLQLWLKRHPEARRNAQDARKCDSRTLKELFKYFTKILIKGDSGKAGIDPYRLDVIFRAMKGRRVYQPMGFTIPKETEEALEAEEIEVKASPAIERADENIVWEYDQGIADWVDSKTGMVLSGHEQDDRMREFCDDVLSGIILGKRNFCIITTLTYISN